MIIACPECKTRYAVADGAIRPEGRTVRCTKCGCSWFQEAPKAPETMAPPAEAPAAAPGIAEPATELRSPPAAAEGPETVSNDEEEESRFDPKPLFASRRTPRRFWAWVAGIVLLVAAAAVTAAYFWGMPGWAPPGTAVFAPEQTGLQLDFPAARQERHRLANGTEFFNASGTITNTGSTNRRVPPILIVLRDSGERIVYRWNVVPPKRSLAPGETITIEEAMADIPPNAAVAEIGWNPD